MFRAAFFDIDGTLLSFKTHQVSPGTIRAFDILHSHNILTFISSGRPPAIIPPMPVSFDGHITMNGGLVLVSDSIIHRQPIPIEESDRWFTFAKQNNLCTMCFTENDMFVTQPNDIGIAIRNQLEFPMPPTLPIDQLFGQQAYQLIAVMPPSMDDEVKRLLPNLRLPRWHPLFTDVIRKDCSKAVGIDKICHHFNIDKSQVLAFGDGGNDIEMLQHCGLGIAMGNASDQVKLNADLVTTSVDDEGILNAILDLEKQHLL